MRAVIYARYSSDSQRPASIEDQARNCRRRIDAEGWILVETFSDAAMSGTDGKRPQYLAMLRAAEVKLFDVLVIDDLSRLTRDSVAQETAIRRLEFRGVRIVTISDGYDSQSKGRRIHRGMKAMMNELYLEDLADRVHRGQEGQARKRFWCGGRPYGYRLRQVVDRSERDSYGNPLRVGTVLEIDTEQAEIVREIFERFNEGAGCTAIAAELNRKGVPSPGSTWKRKVRRARGWMNSGVRVILRNPLYTGLVRWNTHQILRDSDTGKDRRRERPESEWVQYDDESLRIVSDETYQHAQNRTRTKNGDKRLKSGGKPRYLLSGILVCDVCDANYIMADDRSYACSGHVNGGACANHTRVRRNVVERKIIGPIQDQLLSPERVRRMAIEMQTIFAERSKAAAARAETAPRELAELDARIDRLRRRLRDGDPDMTSDEVQVAIDRAEGKRRELTARDTPNAAANVLSMLPRAAELYKNQIVAGLDDDPRATAKARMILRDLFGEIRLSPEDGGLWANFALQPAMLLAPAGTDGRDDRIWAVPAVPLRVRVR